MMILVVIGAYIVSGEFAEWLKLLVVSYNMEILQRVFAEDCQNPEESTRH